MNASETNPTGVAKFDFPGRKICLGALIAGLVMFLINRHGVEIPALMWSGVALILAAGSYTLYQAIRTGHKNIAIRTGIALVFIIAMMALMAVLNSQLAETMQQSASAASHPVTSSAADSDASLPVSFYITSAIVGLSLVAILFSGLTGLIYYLRHDQEAMARWRVRRRWILYTSMGLLLIAMLITFITS